MFQGEIRNIEDIRRILSELRRVAVLGASTDRFRAGFYVPDYLHQRGYTVLPVNPNHAGETLWGRRVVASVAELSEAVEVVDVFRRPDQLPMHVDELVAMQPRPKVVWFQQGIRNDQVARRLIDAGIAVIQDRCMLADHQRLMTSAS